MQSLKSEIITRDWSAEFNALPESVRTIGCAMEARTRIQMLNLEKDRLKRRHLESTREIDEHIAECGKWIARLE